MASLVAVFGVIAFGNCLNDILDFDVDSVAKPNRPIPSGQLSMTGAQVLCAFSAGVATVACLWLPARMSGIVLAMLLLAALYSCWLKGVPLVGNVLVAFQCSAIIFFSSQLAGTIDEWTIGLALTVAAGILSLEIVKCIEDAENDARFGIRTVAHIADKSAIRWLLGAIAIGCALVVFTSPGDDMVQQVARGLVLLLPIGFLSLWWLPRLHWLSIGIALKASKGAWFAVLIGLWWLN